MGTLEQQLGFVVVRSSGVLTSALLHPSGLFHLRTPPPFVANPGATRGGGLSYMGKFFAASGGLPVMKKHYEFYSHVRKPTPPLLEIGAQQGGGFLIGYPFLKWNSPDYTTTHNRVWP